MIEKELSQETAEGKYKKVELSPTVSSHRKSVGMVSSRYRNKTVIMLYSKAK